MVLPPVTMQYKVSGPAMEVVQGEQEEADKEAAKNDPDAKQLEEDYRRRLAPPGASGDEGSDDDSASDGDETSEKLDRILKQLKGLKRGSRESPSPPPSSSPRTPPARIPSSLPGASRKSLR